jgi:Tol biopolymer transport system component
MKSLTGAEHDALSLVNGLARIHRDIGNVLLASHDEKGALEHYLAGLAVIEDFLHRATANLYFQRYRADTQEALGRYYLALAARRPELRAEARTWFQKSLVLWQDWMSRNVATPYAATRQRQAAACPRVISGTPWVLYNVWSGGDQTYIHATDLVTGQQHVVAVNASSPRVAVTPRGVYLLFERASTIFAAPFDRRNASITGSESAIAEGIMNDGTRFAAYFDVSDDGTLVYFPGTSFAEESRLAYVNSDGSTTPFNDDRMSFCEPAFSARAKKMAVLVKGKVYRSLTYDLQRQTREFILTGGDTLSVAISPNGQKFACAVNRDGGYGIDLISLADGRRLGRIVQPGTDYQTDLGWSADAKLLAFSMSPREGTPSDIWLVEPIAGAHPRALISSPGADTKPAISSDGRWMAYQSDVSGRAEVYLVTCPDGQTTRQVTFNGGVNPAWSPDGQTFTSSRPKV